MAEILIKDVEPMVFTLPKRPFEFGEQYKTTFFNPKAKIFVLVGKSATGKSSMAKDICEELPIKQVVNYTSRKPRENEVNGIDYNFVTLQDFIIHEDDFIAVENYNGWRYGIKKSSFNTPENFLVVLTPSGYRELKEEFGDRVVGLYLMSRNIDRIERYMSRDTVNKENITEMVRRLHADDVDFHEFEFEVEHIIINKGKYQNILDQVTSIIMRELF